MPGCVLRASGTDFDVDAFLADSPFEPCAIYHRDQPRFPGSERISDTSGFNLVASDADGDCVPQQIREAAAFVKTQQVELARLMSWPGVEDVYFDFGWDFPVGSDDVLGQYNRFPAELLAACGTLRIGIEVSVYARGKS